MAKFDSFLSKSKYDQLRGATGQSAMTRPTGDIIPKGYSKGQLQQFTPEQMELFQNTFGHLGEDSFLSKLSQGDEDTFNQIEAPALRQFNDISSGIANRYSGLGSGARNSSGFQNQQTAAASNFSQQLQSNRQGLMRQALNDLMGHTNTLLNQRPQEQFLATKPYQQPQHGFGSQLLGGLGSLAGGALGSFAGPLGTAAGSSFGNRLFG